MKSIAIISALTRDFIIGKNNKMPWHISEELQYFKKMTMGKPIIMGRKTFEGLGKKLLPGRRTIVLTTGDLAADGFDVAHNKIEALKYANDYIEKHVKPEQQKQIMIVGGSKIYDLFLNDVDKMYLSWIKGEYTGDTYFPKVNLDNWQVAKSTEYDEFTAQELVPL